MDTEKWYEANIYFINLAIKIIENGYGYKNGNEYIKMELTPANIAKVLKELVKELHIDLLPF